MTNDGPIFIDINPDDPEVSVIESMCMYCHKNGKTCILLTKIPFFKEMIVMSFKCEHCGYANNEIQSGGKVELNGSRTIAIIEGSRDLNRQVVKSEHCTVKIKELDFEIPPQTQKGSLTTVEGLIQRSAEGLRETAKMNMATNPEWASAVLAFCVDKLEPITQQKFTLILDDPSGYSTIENLHLPFPDPKLEIRYYGRTKEQNEALGLQHEDQAIIKDDLAAGDGGLDIQKEVLEFPEICTSCGKPAVCRMKQVQIPFFKEVTIMAVSCDHCGYKSNEVKAGGGIEPKGKKHILKIRTKEDLARDILKSDMASIQIPELEWDIGMGCIAGKFTTLEGILNDLKEHLIDKNPFAMGDSSTSDRNERYATFKSNVDKILNLEIEASFILDDPSGNSYILSLTAPEPDPQLEEIEYERSWDQNEELGLNDMKTENYETDEKSPKE